MEQIRGFIYNAEGRYYGPIYLDGNVNNIAKFIARANNVPKVLLTDMSDSLLIETIGNLVNWCVDQHYLQDELLPALIPMQEGIVDPYEGDIMFNYEDELINKSELKNWVKENLNYFL